MNFKKYNILNIKEVKEMENKSVDFKIADLSSEQKKKIDQIESELGCILIAYEKNQNFK